MTPTSPRRARRTRLGVVAAVAALALAACAPGGTTAGGTTQGGTAPDETATTGEPTAQTTAPAGDLLADHGLDGLDAAQIIERLDAVPLDERPAGLLASVRPEALVLTDDRGRERRLPLPEDRVYVSVAPYRDRTHDCYFHSLTTCVGELRGEDVTVTVTDDATGEVLVQDTRRTHDNGFVGLWLPRGVDATLTVEHDGDTATAAVSTRADDPTCLTGLRLA